MQEDIRLLYIDLFCGAGGTSTGVENAVINGKKIAKVIACVNHDPNAIASHAANHRCIHYTEDIRTLELGPMVKHVELARKTWPKAKVVLWASCECTNLSRAKGGMSRDADSRTLSEHLYRYIEAINPDIIQVENVSEILSNGPLVEIKRRDGSPVMVKKSEGKGKNKRTWEEPAMKPDPDRAGEDYLRWVRTICSYGYHYDYRILNSADYGAYTSRKRYFGMFARPDIPIVFPKATHAKDAGNTLFNDGLKPWLPVRDVLDLNDEGTSIFDRKTPLVDATLKRIYAGLVKFVAGGKQNFLIKWNSMSQSGNYIAPSMDEPCPTVSTQNRIGVGRAYFLTKAYSGDPSSKQTSIESPAGAVTCRDHHQFITAYYGRGGSHSIEAPAPTITTKDRLAMVYIDNQYGNGTPSSIDQPCGTIMINPKQHVVEVKRDPWMMSTNYQNVGQALDEPAKTITADRHWCYILNPQYDCAGNSVDQPAPTVIARQDKLPLQLTSARTTGDLPSFVHRTEDGQILYEVFPEDTAIMRDIKAFMALYGIVDISMRMLRIKELKLIQGFPADYILCGSQQEQKKFLGNAVVTIMAKVWCEAIVPELGDVPAVATVVA